MTTRRSGGCVQAVLVGALLYAAAGVFTFGYADVTSSGLGTVVTPAAGTFDVTGGTRPGGGANLFHSFGNFSLAAAESANFLNDSGLATTNILSRVTGGNPSSIFGTINTLDFPGANLFLMNPAGIVFGPTAQLNVDGSFHATTADYIKLGNDGIFHADPAQASVLTASPPSAFGFLSANPQPIEVQTGGIDFDFFFPAAQLLVPEGQTLSLVGGNAPGSEIPGVSVGALDGSTPGYLVAPAGRVNLVSVASAGEATFDGVGFNVDAFAKLGGIRIGPGSLVDGKEIFIRGGRLVIDDGIVLPGAFAFELSFVGFSPLPDGGEVNIKVTDDVTITGTTFEPLTFEAPGIFVYTGDPFFISPAAKVPDVTIDAGSVSVSGFAAIQVKRNAPGETGEVVINANKVTVGSGGSIALLNFIQGDGPSLTINAKEVDVSGDGSASKFNVEGLFVQGLTHIVYPFFTEPEFITADSGNITINATDSLSVGGLGQITTDSLNFGKAGNITINAGNVLVAGTGDAQSALIGSQSSLTGDAGNITIDATGSITVQDGGRITSATLGSGNAGNVILTAAGPITLSGQDARIVGATFQPPDSQLNAFFASIYGGEPIFDADFNLIGFIPFDFDYFRNLMGNPNASLMQVLAYMRDTPIELPFTTPGPVVLVPIPGLDTTPGNAGTVSLTTPQLTLNTGTRIETSTGWEGNAGSVVGILGSLIVNSGAAIRSRSGVEFLDGTAGVGTGMGGTVTITATDSITVSGAGSAISTTTFGDGAAGDVNLSGNQVDIQNGGRAVSESGGTLGGAFFAGTGNAGTVTITATGPNTLTISGAGSRVSTSTLGAGDGGDVSLTSAGDVQILSGGSVTADSQSSGKTGTIEITAGNSIVMDNGTISTLAVTSDGGNIKLTAPNIVQLNDSQITTSVQSGVGGGGNINIDPQFIILNNSQVIANAFGGPGGNITLVANNFIQSSNSLVQASSALSTPGTIEIVSPENNVAGSIAQLARSFLDASSLLRGLCSARRTGAPSSFVVAGRGGVPVDADGYLPGFGADVAAQVASTEGAIRADAGRRDGLGLTLALAMANYLGCSQ